MTLPDHIRYVILVGHVVFAALVALWGVVAYRRLLAQETETAKPPISESENGRRLEIMNRHTENMKRRPPRKVPKLTAENDPWKDDPDEPETP